MVKKYQVFLSSTADDLSDEREAAFKATIESGNFPSCMEIFSKEHLPPLEIIYEQIDRSDIFILLLGKRYGTIPKGLEKSYIHLEFEYAIQKSKPIYIAKLSEKFIAQKIEQMGYEKILEQNHLKQYNEFVDIIASKEIDFVSSINEIYNFIQNSIRDATEKYNLIGYTRQIDSFTKFKVIEDVDTYIAKKIKQAQYRVLDFTWRDYYPSSSVIRNEPIRKKLQNNFGKAILQISPNVDYREIFTFPDNREERIYKMKKLISLKNYLCGYFLYKRNHIFPKLHFIIIDDEIIFASSLYGQSNYATKDANLLNILESYYNEAWNLCHKVKDITGINIKQLQKCENILEKSDQCK